MNNLKTPNHIKNASSFFSNFVYFRILFVYFLLLCSVCLHWHRLVEQMVTTDNNFSWKEKDWDCCVFQEQALCAVTRNDSNSINNLKRGKSINKYTRCIAMTTFVNATVSIALKIFVWSQCKSWDLDRLWQMPCMHASTVS